MALSPMMQQYMEIKELHKDCILFFRLGDFYEMFFEDAITCTRELDLTLTGKQCGLEERAPMCGVPYHSAEGYVAKLIEKGYKVAICEQTGEIPAGKGIVKREVVQIVTPGTISGSTVIDEKENIYLASIFYEKNNIGFAYCDVSTGELYGTEISGDDSIETLINEIVRLGVKEIIYNQELADIFEDVKIDTVTKAFLSSLPKGNFSQDNCKEIILEQTGEPSLIKLGLEGKNKLISALGSLLIYIKETQKNTMEHLRHLSIYQIGAYMTLDKATIRNLELVETIHEKTTKGSLIWTLDKTKTAMGGRKLKKWIKEPLNKIEDINQRLDGVNELVLDLFKRNHIKESLKQIYDFERLIGRIVSGNANGKDLIALRNSISNLPDIKFELEDCQSTILKNLGNDVDTLEEIFELINESITDEPPFTVREGGLIKDGFSTELDEIKFSIKDAKDWIANLEGKEKEATGIKTLKVGYNKIFGYYIEVTKSAYDLVPEHYIRKQTLANAERFITADLKEMEGIVLNAEGKINSLEYEIFTDIKEKIKGFIGLIQKTSGAIASVDVLLSFAEVSSENGYVKPEMTNKKDIILAKGRHPVIEKSIKDGIFVPNDFYINGTSASMLLITGPNMAGKSTYMRQTAIIVLMAQIGCFVPCESAKIGVVDRIFTRIGASDNLAQSQSTFFVEMSELAYILKHATDRSLVILDEIGRGTSTHDGLSIAWAIAEHLCKEEENTRTLFATHYHELIVLEEELKGFKNLTVDIAEENGEIVFLHKIKEGSASKSYGIHVAELAGVPKELLAIAEVKLEELERDSKVKENHLQLSFFS